MEKKKSGRLFSLDLLRGLDIFLLTAVGPFVWAVHRTWGDYDNPAWWLDPVKTNIFSGALLVIAVAIAVVSLWMLIPSRRVQVAVPMVVYAGVIAPSGALCVQYIQSTGSGLRKTLTIAGVGIALLAAGWAISPWVPMTKRIMTTSFTLAALGWCLLALAACYYITDVKGWRKGLWIFTLYGQCSLAAYVIDEQFRATFRSAAQPFIGGLVQWFGAQYQEMFLWVFMIAVQTYVLFVWREYRSRS